VGEGDAGSDNAGFGGVNEIDRRRVELLWNSSPGIEDFGDVAVNEFLGARDVSELDFIQSRSFSPRLTSICSAGGSWGLEGTDFFDDCDLPLSEPMDRNAFNLFPLGCDFPSGD
jgi:hypothetical protein